MDLDSKLFVSRFQPAIDFSLQIYRNLKLNVLETIEPDSIDSLLYSTSDSKQVYGFVLK